MTTGEAGIEAAARAVREAAASHVMIGVTDIDGVIRGKYLEKEKLLSALAGGTAMCRVVFGWDSRDQLYATPYTGWFNGFPDDGLRIVPESLRMLPEGGTPFLLAEFTGEGAKICPRNLAGRVIARAASMGLTVKGGFEYEFYGFRETVESARAKGFRNLAPLTPTTGGYSVLRANVHADFFLGMLALSRTLKTPIEGLHPEAGEGALEYALSPAEGIDCADRAAIFKTFSKAWAQRNGILLSYMAKPVAELPGCGGHLHLSLWREDGAALFHDAASRGGLSKAGRAFVAGQQKYMAELLSMTAPTINAFTRLTPGYWAPTAATWGFDNRTCALRVVGSSPKSIRVEYRVTSADANPYLVLSAALASGLAGIEEGLEPEEATDGNAYEQVAAEERRLPPTLHEAAGRLRASAMARRWFGAEFVEHFVLSREAEEQSFRRHVTDWELERYMEII